jgi:hypothetical protein
LYSARLPSNLYLAITIDNSPALSRAKARTGLDELQESPAVLETAKNQQAMSRDDPRPHRPQVDLRLLARSHARPPAGHSHSLLYCQRRTSTRAEQPAHHRRRATVSELIDLSPSTTTPRCTAQMAPATPGRQRGQRPQVNNNIGEAGRCVERPLAVCCDGRVHTSSSRDQH